MEIDQAFIKKTKNWRRGLVCALIPLVICLLRLAIDGKSLGDIYLPNSQWNDELLYYKITDGCVKYTIPQGFFGFNESQARIGSFAAWSPAISVFFNMWGMVFGWNYLSPILCNLTLTCAGLYFVGRFMHMNLERYILTVLVFISFIPITRFTLSGMPEAQIYTMLISMIFLTWDTDQSSDVEQKNFRIRIWIALVLAVLLTLMRPYYLLIFICPTYIIWKQKGKKQAIMVTAITASITIVVYGLLNYFFSAPYLTDLFYTDWITAYKNGLIAGLKYDFWKLFQSLKSIFIMMTQKSPDGKLLAGSLYFLFLLCLVYWIALFIKKDKFAIPFILRIQMVVIMAGFFGADLMMYRLQEGGRHTIPFIYVTLLTLPFMLKEEADVKEKWKIKNIGWALPTIIGVGVTAGTLLFLGNIPYEYDIPYATEERVQELDTLKADLEAKVGIIGMKPTYENTVIWPIWDEVDGETVVFDWGALYTLPSGMGISACDGGYVEAQLGNLKCKYIATTPGSDISKWCEENEKTCISKNNTVVVWRNTEQ